MGFLLSKFMKRSIEKGWFKTTEKIKRRKAEIALVVWAVWRETCDKRAWMHKKGLRIAPQACALVENLKLQRMAERGVQTGREDADVANGVVSAAERAVSAPFEVGRDIRECHWGVGSGFGFECPLFLGTIDLVQVVDAGIHLSGRTGFDKVRDGDSREKADDRHDDHDFHQGKAGFAI
jgi:hypothetical protein